MEFLVRQLEDRLDETCVALAGFLGADPGSMVLVDNATTGMNIIANSISLDAGDEVLLNDHEYGAVQRIWGGRCRQVGARTVIRRLPWPVESDDRIVESLAGAMNDRTRLVVVSHVTSPTATIFPVRKICQVAAERGIPVAVDGPHAVAMLPVDIEQLGCDYYTASCHKWLSAGFGSGFLWVRRRHQPAMKPSVISWGGSISGREPTWKDEFTWSGTRDPAAWLTIPAAIEFLESYGLERFREQTHLQAADARRRLVDAIGLEPPVPDSRDWYASMVVVPLPPADEPSPRQGHPDPLQRTLQRKYGIEIPVISFHDQRYMRVSCHLYNTSEDIDRLVEAVRQEVVG